MDTNEFIKQWCNEWYHTQRLYSKFASDNDITLVTLEVLVKLYETKTGITQKELCEKLLIPKQTLSNLFTVLIDKSYVKKIDKENDKRSFYFVLTTSGKEYFMPIYNELQKAEYEVFNSFSEEELECYLKMNIKFNKLLEKKLLGENTHD